MSRATWIPGHRRMRTRELRARGWTVRQIADAVRDGRLRRVRRGGYATSSTPDTVLRAAEHGGRLDCISWLAELGVFVLERPATHIQIDRTASRAPRPPKQMVRHWRSSTADPDALTAPLVEALAQSVRCQGARNAVTTLDSACHLGLVDEEDLNAVFALLPHRLRSIRRLIDGRSESGPESLVRLMLRALGRDFDVQVEIDGVGRVDFVVDGWLVIECDSREFHSSPKAQLADRERDLALASRGYLVLRLLAEDIMYRRDRVLIAMCGVLGRHRGF
ncbi:endonuclease domain-containing protein [Microbacterium tumbae]